ncbi:MAG: DUF4157 domain-containing protein [Acidobacteriota bacterium]
MRLAPKTHQQLETFFRQYFDDESLKLPIIKIYSGRRANLITKLIGVDGITIGRRIIIKPKLIKPDENNRFCMSKNLLSHEVTHVLQYQKLGFLSFLYKYFSDYFINLKSRKKLNATARLESYWEIPHEIEARDAAKKFVEWIKSENEE